MKIVAQPAQRIGVGSPLFQLANIFREFGFICRAQGNLPGLRSREGEFGLFRQQKVNELLR